MSLIVIKLYMNYNSIIAVVMGIILRIMGSNTFKAKAMFFDFYSHQDFNPEKQNEDTINICQGNHG